MRLIIDSNQVDPIRNCIELPLRVKQDTTLVLPAEVFQELASGSKGSKRLEGLRAYDLRFGWFVGDIWSKIGNLTEAQVFDFDPIMPYGHDHSSIKTTLRHAPAALAGRGAAFRQDRASWANELCCKMRDAAKGLREMTIRGESPELFSMKDLDDAFAQLCGSDSSPVGATIIESASSNRNAWRHASNPTRFLKAVYSNPCILRFLRVLIAYHLGYANLNEVPELKGRVSVDEGDLADMTLALYARDGDVIVSCDKKFKRVLAYADSSCRVRVMRWREYLDWRQRP